MVFSAISRNSAGTSSFGSIMPSSSGLDGALSHFSERRQCLPRPVLELSVFLGGFSARRRDQPQGAVARVLCRAAQSPQELRSGTAGDAAEPPIAKIPTQIKAGYRT